MSQQLPNGSQPPKAPPSPPPSPITFPGSAARSRSPIGKRIFWIILSVLILHCLYIVVLSVVNEIRLQSALHEVYPDGEFQGDLSNYEWNDPELIGKIKEHFLVRPAPRLEAYALSSPSKSDYAQDIELSQVVHTYLKDHDKERDGFFVEAGAYDGELLSNTLRYERDLNWTGLLVEPNPLAIRGILRKKRKAWLLKGCLHPGRSPKMLTLLPTGWCGGIDIAAGKRAVLSLFYPVKSIQVWCFPLESVLQAVGQYKIDYMILDTEGGELDVMKSLNWTRVDIKLLQVEYHVFNGKMFNREDTMKNRAKILNYMNSAHGDNYKLYYDFIGSWSRDFVFVKNV